MSLQVSIPTSQGTWELKNPIMPAAATFGNIIEYKDLVDLTRLGALIPNSLSTREGAPAKAKKFYAAECGVISSFSLNNMTVEQFVSTVLPELPYRATPIVVDLKAYDMDEMRIAVEQAAAAEGISAIEINLNCPYGHPGAAPYWKNRQDLEELIKISRKAAGNKVLIVKTATSEVPLGDVINISADNGADMFVSFNGISGGCSIDIHTRAFQCGGGGMGGYSGPGLKPYAMGRAVSAAKINRLPIIAAGGITKAEDVIEYTMAGAYAVQIGAANLMTPDAMIQILEDLEVLMATLGIKSLDEIRGVVL